MKSEDELAYIVACWGDLTPATQNKIIGAVLADRVAHLPPIELEEAQRYITRSCELKLNKPRPKERTRARA